MDARCWWTFEWYLNGWMSFIHSSNVFVYTICIIVVQIVYNIHFEAHECHPIYGICHLWYYFILTYYWGCTLWKRTPDNNPFYGFMREHLPCGKSKEGCLFVKSRVFWWRAIDGQSLPLSNWWIRSCWLWGMWACVLRFMVYVSIVELMFLLNCFSSKCCVSNKFCYWIFFYFFVWV